MEREIRIMDVQPTNLQQLCDAIMSIWTKISKECFQNLVESMPRRIKAVLKEKGVQPGTIVPNKVASECVCGILKTHTNNTDIFLKKNNSKENTFSGSNI